MPINANESAGPERGAVFHWRELSVRLAQFAARWPNARGCAAGRSFVAANGAAQLWVPFAASPVTPGEAIASYRGRFTNELGRQWLVLLQAGAVALGAWQGEELVSHKAIRKYVVRGHGRAQPTHAKTRGKSRYGSRLRLQNWKRLLVETNERLVDWRDRLGSPDRIFFGAPVRAWPELWQVDPPPPFCRDDEALSRLPIHVHRPDHEELLAVRRWLERGRMEGMEATD